ncbi:hypothetical protein L486_07180 [Kwoniella mangroviensis CBS 10435]|uniref:Ricin B lectin domain-containing protein n=1 Tax=Kwoniella mangroviensis CBS 10435 TaxID=1331196 RepID=A0A1B9II59_9TREE|nr:hypothetical protein L486_07180 [Kwoniella mangroviensis CBS 10435]
MVSPAHNLGALILILSILLSSLSSPINAQPTGLLQRRTARHVAPNTSVQLKQVTRTELIERSKRKATRTAKRYAAPSCSTSDNRQMFTGALGGIAAPAVYGCSGTWVTSGQRYNFEIDALNASCYKQMDQCQLAANQSGNRGDLTVSNCNGQQVQACLKLASETAS